MKLGVNDCRYLFLHQTLRERHGCVCDPYGRLAIVPHVPYCINNFSMA